MSKHLNKIEIPFKSYKETGVTILGSSNIDLFLYVEDFPVDGETLHAKQLIRSEGGKGSNQATMVSNLSSKNAKNIFLGCVGDDANGVQILDNYKRRGFFEVEKHCRTIKGVNSGHASVIVNNKGVNRIILDYGANNMVKPSHFDDSFEDIKKNTTVFVAQFEVNLDAVEYCIKKAKNGGLFTILNPAPAKKKDLTDLYKYVDLIIPNETECEILTGISIKNKEDAMKGCKKLREMGCKNIIVTLGSSGVVVMKDGQEEIVYCDVPLKLKKEEVLDTTGAGDTFVGALAYFLSCSEDLMKAVKYSMYIATLSVAIKGKGCQGSQPKLDEKREKLYY